MYLSDVHDRSRYNGHGLARHLLLFGAITPLVFEAIAFEEKIDRPPTTNKFFEYIGFKEGDWESEGLAVVGGTVNHSGYPNWRSPVDSVA